MSDLDEGAPLQITPSEEYLTDEQLASIDGNTLRRWANMPENKHAASALYALAAEMDDKTSVDKVQSYSHASLPPEAFNNQQMTLFQDFAVDKPQDRDDLSNNIAFWDCVPRYSISVTAMKKMRINNQFLTTHSRTFRHENRTFTVEIQPCFFKEKIETAGGVSVLSDVAYYPSANEEVVEEALRKLATEKDAGFYDARTNPHRGGVLFSLYELVQELKRMGHTRSFTEIKKSLHILANSVITLSQDDSGGTSNLPSFRASPYLSSLGRYSSGDGDEGNSKWLAAFHPLVVDGINNLAYRQYNYTQLMRLTSQLSRWFLRILIAKYTFASRLQTFAMELNTVVRDSGLLDGYGRLTAAHEACVRSFEELKCVGVLRHFEFVVETGPRGKMLNVKYILSAGEEFIKDAVTANKRVTKQKTSEV